MMNKRPKISVNNQEIASLTALKGSDDEKEKGFIYDSIVRRLPSILSEVLEANKTWLSPTQVSSIKALSDELENGSFLMPAGTLVPYWKDSEMTGTCLSAPWFYVENFVYHVLLLRLEYFNPGHVWFMKDPFLVQKTRAIQSGITPLKKFIKLCGPNRTLNDTLAESLWGNQADLSVSSGKVLDHMHDNTILLVDDRHRFESLLATNIVPDLSVTPKIIIILDNCGAELLNDLCLCDYLLQTYQELHIVFHAKRRPVFVSDALPIDVEYHLQELENCDETLSIASRLRISSLNGRFSVSSHEFYNGHLPYNEIPDDLIRAYKSALCVISKGDANYRRLLGDLHWDPTTPFQDVVGRYFPTNLLALRTCKSPIICGVSTSDIERAKRFSSNQWCLNGKAGLIQFSSLSL